jgi:hypothetical protein
MAKDNAGTSKIESSPDGAGKSFVQEEGIFSPSVALFCLRNITGQDPDLVNVYFRLGPPLPSMEGAKPQQFCYRNTDQHACRGSCARFSSKYEDAAVQDSKEAGICRSKRLLARNMCMYACCMCSLIMSPTFWRRANLC